MESESTPWQPSHSGACARTAPPAASSATITSRAGTHLLLRFEAPKSVDDRLQCLVGALELLAMLLPAQMLAEPGCGLDDPVCSLPPPNIVELTAN